MSEMLPIRIDPFRLVEQKRSLKGRVSVSSMPRLMVMLSGKGQEDCSVELEFGKGQRSNAPEIRLRVEAEIDLACQRCLGDLHFTVNTESELVLIQHEAQAEQYEGLDTLLVEEDQPLTISELVEDELLLSLPMVPMHDNEADCEQHIEPEFTVQDTEIEAEPKQNPFSVLKTLKDGD